MQQHRQRHDVLEARAEEHDGAGLDDAKEDAADHAAGALPKPPMIAAMKPLMPNGPPTL